MDWTDITIRRTHTKCSRTSCNHANFLGERERSSIQIKSARRPLSDASTNLPCLALTAQTSPSNSALRRCLLLFRMSQTAIGSPTTGGSKAAAAPSSAAGQSVNKRCVPRPPA